MFKAENIPFQADYTEANRASAAVVTVTTDVETLDGF